MVRSQKVFSDEFIEVLTLVEKEDHPGVFSSPAWSVVDDVLNTKSSVDGLGRFRELRQLLEVAPRGTAEVDRELKRG
jgi:hypothetical protein